jgi:hypothetical protein
MPQIQRIANQADPNKETVRQKMTVDPGRSPGTDDACRAHRGKERPIIRETSVLLDNPKAGSDKRQAEDRRAAATENAGGRPVSLIAPLDDREDDRCDGPDEEFPHPKLRQEKGGRIVIRIFLGIPKE